MSNDLLLKARAAAAAKIALAGDQAAAVDPEGGIAAALAPEAKPPVNDATASEVLAGSIPGRFALGAVSRGLGAAQLLSHVDPNPDIKNSIEAILAKLEAMKKKGMEAAGTEGFDWAGLAGSVATPGGLGGVVSKGAGFLPKVLAGAGQGGIVGATTPVQGDTSDFAKQKAEQVGMGMGAGGLLSGAGTLLGKYAVTPTTNFLRSVFGSTEGKAGRLTANIAGDQKEAVVNALMAAQSRVPGEKLTAGQAAVPAMSPEFSALQEIVANRAPGKYGSGGIEGKNEAARQALLATKAGTPDDIAAAEAARTAVTRPLRETALDNANLSAEKAAELSARLASQKEAVVNALKDKGRFQTTAAQQDVLANKTFPVEGMPRIPGRYTENAERIPEARAAAADAASIEATRKAQANLTQFQLESLAAHGQYPLQAKPILQSLTSSLSQPGIRASDVAQKTLGALRSKIESLTDAKGIVNARDLYTIRKEVGNTIETFAKETSNWDKKMTSGLQRQAQTAIDHAIESSGGTGWGDYLRKYVEMSRPIENMQVAQKLQKVLTEPLGVSERPAAFAKVAADEKTPITSAQTQSVIDSIMESLSRDATHSKLAKEGASAATRKIGAEVSAIPSTGMFNPKVSVARALLNQFGDRGTGKVMDFLADKMDDPAAIAALIREASKPEQNALIKALLERSSIIPTAASSATARAIGGN